MLENVVVYEQPLNELIRVCLRLEQLFQQMDHQIADTSIAGTRNLVTVIIHLLHLLDRPDLKAKLAKELGHQLAYLARLDKTPEIHQEKLHQILQQLEELMRCFIDSSGKIGQSLRDVEFLNHLRLHLTSPGGGCSFDIPLFRYWLEQPADKRHCDLKRWLEEFTNIRSATTLILKLVRESAKIQEKIADHGFYQELLDPQIQLRMLRIGIQKDVAAFPEMSIGRHFLSVRFFSPLLLERPPQYQQPLTFWIAHCGA